MVRNHVKNLAQTVLPRAASSAVMESVQNLVLEAQPYVKAHVSINQQLMLAVVTLHQLPVKQIMRMLMVL